MLARELVEGSLSGGKWTYKESDAYNFNEQEADAFDSNFRFSSRVLNPAVSNPCKHFTCPFG